MSSKRSILRRGFGALARCGLGATLLVGVAAPSLAGVNEWTTAGPDGGEIEELVTDPTAPSTVYAVSPNVGVYRSTDRCESWEEASAGLPIFVLDIAVTSDGTLFTVDAFNEVHTSSDSGESWSPSHSGLEGVVVAELVAHPTEPGTVYAGTLDAGVYKTVDSGVSWAASHGGIETARITAVAVDPLTPSTVYTGVSGDAVYKSVDDGATWSPSGTGIEGADVTSLAIDPGGSATLFAGLGSPAPLNGVYRSLDGGASWTPTNGAFGDFEDVLALAIDPTTTTTLYAGASQTGIYKSDDGGANWSPLVFDSGAETPRVQALVVNPQFPQRVCAGLGSGAYISSDSGASWSREVAGLRSFDVDQNGLATTPNDPDTLYALGINQGIQRSLDGAGSWSATGSGLALDEPTELIVAPAEAETLYAATYPELYRSVDGGGTWTQQISDPATFGLLGAQITALAAHPSDPDTLYAGNNTNFQFLDPEPTVLRSTDGGVTWEVLYRQDITDLFSYQPEVVAVDPSDPDRVFVASLSVPPSFTFNASVLRTVDGGVTWEEVLYDDQAWPAALAVDPSNSQRVYAVSLGLSGNPDEVWRSVDGGASWTALGLDPDDGLRSFAIDPSDSDTLYAASESFWRSRDGGDTWEPIDVEGWPERQYVWQLSVTSENQPTIHAGSNRGIYSYKPGPLLAISGDCPGLVSLALTDATPGANVAVLRSNAPGSSVIPSGSCAGTSLDLANPSLQAVLTADPSGEVSLTPNVPAPACAQFVQWVDLSTCFVSNVERIPN